MQGRHYLMYYFSGFWTQISCPFMKMFMVTLGLLPKLRVIKITVMSPSQYTTIISIKYLLPLYIIIIRSNDYDMTILIIAQFFTPFLKDCPFSCHFSMLAFYGCGVYLTLGSGFDSVMCFDKCDETIVLLSDALKCLFFSITMKSNYSINMSQWFDKNSEHHKNQSCLHVWQIACNYSCELLKWPS